MTRITKRTDGTLLVPHQLDIPFFIRDSIGPDSWRTSVGVFNATVEKDVTVDFFNQLKTGKLLKTSEFSSAIIDKINPGFDRSIY